MKKLLALLVAAAFVVPAMAADEAPKTRKVCVDVQGKDGKPVVDPKTKKNKQECKEVKAHKKHEGTAVPEKKK
jgi:azurin